jgi:hypothetical protein
MPNPTNTIVVGKTKGGYRDHYYRDARGRYFRCHVLSQQAGPTYTIRVLSRSGASKTLAGIGPGTAKT